MDSAPVSPVPVLGMDETDEQRAAVEAEAKALAASMREVDIAAFAVRARGQIATLEAAVLAERAACAAETIAFWRDRPLGTLAADFRARIEADIAAGHGVGDRLPVARDLLARVIELLT